MHFNLNKGLEQPDVDAGSCMCETPENSNFLKKGKNRNFDKKNPKFF